MRESRKPPSLNERAQDNIPGLFLLLLFLQEFSELTEFFRYREDYYFAFKSIYSSSLRGEGAGGERLFSLL